MFLRVRFRVSVGFLRVSIKVCIRLCTGLVSVWGRVWNSVRVWVFQDSS